MIAANFTKSQKSITVESVTQGDYGQKLSIHGLGLPSSVEVHFVAAGEQEGIKMFGTTQAEETVVEIPNLLIAKGKDLTAYIFVCDSMEGKTVRTIRIPVHRKPEVEEIELPPDEQDIVRELMGLMNGFESEIDKLDEKKADKTMIGTPLVADSIRDMRDMEKIYVYVGNEIGELIPGNWYYWDGNYWVSGGVYNAVALGERSVTTGKLANYSVSERCIADGAVTEVKLGNQAVSERCIVDGAVTEAKMGDLAVSERCIVDGAVTEAKLGDLAVSERCIVDGAVTPDKLDRLYKEITLTEKTTGTFFDISKEARKVVIGFENKMVDDHLYACRKNIWNLKKQDGIITGKNAAVRSQIVYSVVEDGAIYLRGQWKEDPIYIPLGIEYQAEMLLGKKLHVAMFNVYGAIPYGISFHMGMNVSGESVLSNHTMMNHIGEVQETIDEEGRLCLRIEKGLDLQQEIGIGLLCEIILDDSEASTEFTNGEKKEILNQKAITPDRKTWIFTKNGSTIYKAIPEDEQPPEFILLKSEAGTTFRIRVTDAGELSIEADR